MTQHYLDNSATTKVLEEAAKTAVSFMTAQYGNPSSLHTMGFEAKCALDTARETVAKSLHALPEEMYFTSGGTEANNLAIWGALKAKRRLGNKIVTTAMEHPSVLEVMKEAEKQGFEVVYLRPDSTGTIPAEGITEAIDKKTILVSIMLVNNETGAILPVKAAADAIRRKKSPALLHTDAVQAYLKTDCFPGKLGTDLLTVSGHKVHAPKGVGALYVAKKTRILPLLIGGGQERGLRSGTESMPLIMAFHEAVRQSGDRIEQMETVRALNRKLRELLKNLPQVTIHSPADASPYILNFSAGRVRAETMLHFLAERNVYVSSGSACGRAKPSHVLMSMGLDKAQVESSLRVSFSQFSTEEDILALVRGLEEGLSKLKVDN